MITTRNTKNSTYHKALILSYIKDEGSKTITELAKKLEVTRPTIYGHLDVLEQKGLIKREKDMKKKGSPVIISLTKKADPVPLKVLETTKKTWDKVTSILK